MSAGRWLQGYGAPRPGAVRLVCLPHAGGAAGYFHPLARELAADFDVVGGQYPGRQERYREPLLRSIAGLADGVFAAWAAEPRPTVLFGHSLGAVVAFETALRMERAGATDLLGVIVSGRRAPSVPRTDAIHRRDDQGIVREIRELSGTRAAVFDDPDLLAMVLPVLRADYQAVETYRAAPADRLRAPVAVLIGDADPRVPVAEADRWRTHTDGPTALRVLPGGHFYLDNQHDRVAAAIRDSVHEFRSQVPA
ncbi:thioesterase II family protein [Solwaraspora sp. WMMB335]|uniref:thioesterase II family protein n=1 Tax=Solwaraspora sp. WMMB335 TaxID=3404118 RepID=UPI003B94C3DC